MICSSVNCFHFSVRSFPQGPASSAPRTKPRGGNVTKFPKRPQIGKANTGLSQPSLPDVRPAGQRPHVAPYHCLKQCSRCHLRKSGRGWSDMRRGASARPDLLIIDRTACGSFVCRETNISKSSAKLISPRSNIQCAVPERAIPLLMISGPLASTGRICAAATSARPLPLMNFRPVMAQRSSYARSTTRRKTLSRKILDMVTLVPGIRAE
jgi:hypothetical protein